MLGLVGKAPAAVRIAQIIHDTKIARITCASADHMKWFKTLSIHFAKEWREGGMGS